MTSPPANRKVHRNTGDLIAAGLIDENARTLTDAVAQRYGVAITPAVRALIDPTDTADPIARQFVPSPLELVDRPSENGDPIGDEAFSPVKGIVHRYPDRVLLKLLHTCPVYCRYCFRRERVGQGEPPLGADEISAALDYVRARPDIWEVILTGGDPFLLSSRRLRETVAALDAIDHLGVIRVHTRVPVIDPERIDAARVAALSADKAVYVVIHCNHARELSQTAVAAIRRIVDAGIPVLAQSVLLKGVNDDAPTLEALFRALVRARVKPYYLHHPDQARGTGHFRPTLASGRQIVDSLRGRLSGLCQPTYVLDIPGGYGKVPVAIDRTTETGDGAFLIRDPQDRIHRYQDEIDGAP
ncbi:MAG: lysine-2,3-aminomutase-like protein [Alphaproteobacteria bacterium]